MRILAIYCKEEHIHDNKTVYHEGSLFQLCKYEDKLELNKTATYFMDEELKYFNSNPKLVVKELFVWPDQELEEWDLVTHDFIAKQQEPSKKAIILVNNEEVTGEFVRFV